MATVLHRGDAAATLAEVARASDDSARGMAVDYFLQIAGIEGESTDAKHKDWIDVDSWSWGEAQTVQPRHRRRRRRREGPVPGHPLHHAT